MRGRKARKPQGRLAGAKRYPEAAIYFQQDVLSLKHIRDHTTAGKMQARAKKGEGIRPKFRYK